MMIPRDQALVYLESYPCREELELFPYDILRLGSRYFMVRFCSTHNQLWLERFATAKSPEKTRTENFPNGIFQIGRQKDISEVSVGKSDTYLGRYQGRFRLEDDCLYYTDIESVTTPSQAYRASFADAGKSVTVKGSSLVFCIGVDLFFFRIQSEDEAVGETLPAPRKGDANTIVS